VTRSPNATTIKFLTVKEVSRLLKAIKSKRDLALVYVAYRHGLRISEARTIKRDDVNFSTGQIFTRRLKGSRSAWQALDKATAGLIQTYLSTRSDSDPVLFRSKKGGPLSSQHVARLFTAYATTARISPDKRHFHVLKHSCATHLLEASKDIVLVQEWLGHADIRNTMLYADLIGVVVNERVKALSGAFVGV